jgi:hypothetical protein
MRHDLIVLGLLCSIVGCAAPAGKTAKSPASAGDKTSRDVAKEPATSGKKSQGTHDWDEAQPFESSTSGVGTGNRKSRIIVTSDPAKHGDFIHFRFAVNAVPISGVFVAPGGQSTTFTIPVGTVHFTVDECGWETQGFELLPDEEIPIACKLTKEGDCCEVAIPVEETPKANAKVNAKAKPTKTEEEE